MAEDISLALDAACGSWDWSSGVSFNTALVFVKPHAANPIVTDFVRYELEGKKLRVLCEGSITAAEIEKGNLIDSHYAAIATHAMKTDPAELKFPDEQKTQFAETFEIAWHAALQTGTVMNAAQAMEKLAQDGAGLEAVWAAAPTKFKLAPGLYVAKCSYVMGENDDGDEVGVPAEEGADGASTIFLINGFYGAMRQMFIAEGASIHYFVVGFAGNEVTWKQFRGDIIGPTDPASAGADSLRGKLYRQWESLGMSSEPTISKNGVHASAGPLEGLKERMVWLGLVPDNDPYGQKLLEVVWGERESQLDGMLNNAKVTFAGKNGPIFDLTEDKDSLEVLCMCNNVTFATEDETKDWYGAEDEASGEQADGDAAEDETD